MKNLQPQGVWQNFAKLTQIPRPSGKKEQISQFLVNYGKSLGLETQTDAIGNVLIRKPASPGYENHPGVILQGHMDMVPQKNSDRVFDFEKDPIEAYVDDEGWVRAKGTTLGADNGLGVAAIMAVMEDTTMKHGLIEGLITADEETGLYGANGLPEGELHGDIMLNLDSESWGKFVIGSAGGINITSTLDYQEVDTDVDDVALKVTLKGLHGGHSGLDIHKGFANANKLMVRFVREAIAEYEARLASWHGGNMRNAIPFQASVVLTMPKENVEAVQEMVDEWKAVFEDEYKGIESNIEFFTEEVETPAKELPEAIQDNLVDAIYAAHDGVIRMIPAYPDVVETSSNLAIVDIEAGKAFIKILARSSRESTKDYVTEMLSSCFNMAGMKVETDGSYGGWDPNPDSPLLHSLLAIYKEQNGEDGIIQIDHAGLECSIILGKYPHLDVVSMGPTLRSPHTTSERALVSTVEPFWKLLKAVIEA